MRGIVFTFLVLAAFASGAADFDPDGPEIPLRPSPLLNRSNPTIVTALSFIPHGLDVVYFPPRSAKLTKKAKRILDRQSTFIERHPDAPLDLVGYADWVENGHKDKVDHKLGIKRADAVLDYLAAKGIPRERFFIKSYGSRAILPKDMTEKTQRQLRCVEVLPHQDWQ